MANRRSKQPQGLTRKQLSKREREERQQRILYVIVGLAAAAAVLVLGFGAYQEYVVRPSAPVAVVNGEPVTTKDYQLRVKYRRFELANQQAVLEAQLARLDPTQEDEQFLVQYLQQQVQQVQSQSIVLPTQVLDDLIDEVLVQQEANRRGISVTPADVQQEIESLFGFERNPPTPEPTPTVLEGQETPTPVPTVQRMTQQDFEKDYNEYVLTLHKEVGMSEQDFRHLFEMTLLRDKVGESFAQEVPTVDEQVHARHILVETKEEALNVLDRLAAGEDFAALADELSLDTSAEGGDLGWFPRGVMVPEFEEVAFTLPVGEISDPVETSYGYHIIQVLDRELSRPLDEATLEQRKQAALTDWLAEARQADSVQRYWSSDKVPPAG